MSRSPTIETYPELQRVFSFFNEHLFEGKLSAPLFVLESSVRFAGYFSKNKYVSADGSRKTHQIALNPAAFHESSVKDNLSTILHEMCHQYQSEYGREPRRCYHDKQWAEYMEERGLIPSDTGLPGGKKTGQRMNHYIEEGGRFDVLADQLIAEGFSFAWHDPHTLTRYREQKRLGIITKKKTKTTQADEPLPVAAASATTHASTAVAVSPPTFEAGAPLYNSSNRVKYICMTCSQQAWGKRGLKILCGQDQCDKRPMEAEDDY